MVTKALTTPTLFASSSCPLDLVETLRNHWQQQKQQVIRAQKAIWLEKQRRLTQEFHNTSQKLLAIIQFHENKTKHLEAHIQQLEETIETLTCECAAATSCVYQPAITCEAATQTEPQPNPATELPVQQPHQVEARVYEVSDQAVAKPNCDTTTNNDRLVDAKSVRTTTTTRPRVTDTKKSIRIHRVNPPVHQLLDTRVSADTAKVQESLQSLFNQLERLKSINTPTTGSVPSLSMVKSKPDKPLPSPTQSVPRIKTPWDPSSPMERTYPRTWRSSTPVVSGALSSSFLDHQMLRQEVKQLESGEFRRSVLKTLGVCPSHSAPVLAFAPSRSPDVNEPPIADVSCVDVGPSQATSESRAENENQSFRERSSRLHQLLEKDLLTKLQETELNQSAVVGNNDANEKKAHALQASHSPTAVTASSPVTFTRVA